MWNIQVFVQIFYTDETGQILTNSRKTFQTLEENNGIQISVHLRNRMAVMIRTVKQKHRIAMVTAPQIYENISTLQCLVKTNRVHQDSYSDHREKYENGVKPREATPHTFMKD